MERDLELVALYDEVQPTLSAAVPTPTVRQPHRLPHVVGVATWPYTRRDAAYAVGIHRSGSGAAVAHSLEHRGFGLSALGVCDGSFDLCDRCDTQGTSAKADYGFVAVTWAGAPLAKSGCYAIIRVWSAKYVKP